jgi:hypothetical protein
MEDIAPMTLGDVAVSKMLTDDQIMLGIIAGTGLRGDQVLIVSEIPEQPVVAAIVLLCQKIQRGGDFPLQLSFYAEPNSFGDKTVEAILETFCSVCDCDVLVSDDSVNPYTRILITSLGKHHHVSLDVARLDDADEFVIQTII